MLSKLNRRQPLQPCDIIVEKVVIGMPRFKQTADILKLMKDKQHIRDIGIIAHITEFELNSKLMLLSIVSM